MILKIKQTNKSDGWFIYDNAEGVAYSRHPDIRPFFHDSMGQDAQENIVAFVDDTDMNHVQGSFFNSIPLTEGTPEPGWFLTFCKQGFERYEFWGDTELYLLNDSGKTIERIF